MVDIRGEFGLRTMGPERAILTTKDAKVRDLLLKVREIGEGERVICFTTWAPGMNALVEDWFDRKSTDLKFFRGVLSRVRRERKFTRLGGNDYAYQREIVV